MKISINVDLTPEEIRRLFGLPILNEVQDEFIKKMKEKFKNEEVDPEKMMDLLGSSLKSGEKIMETFVNNLNKSFKNENSKNNS